MTTVELISSVHHKCENVSYGNPFLPAPLGMSSWHRSSLVWEGCILCDGIAAIQVSYTGQYRSSTQSMVRTLRQLLSQVAITSTQKQCVLFSRNYSSSSKVLMYSVEMATSLLTFVEFAYRRFRRSLQRFRY